MIRKCARCGSTQGIHTHHVMGRVGPEKNEPFNLIELCAHCHHLWHNKRSDEFEYLIYRTMKERHGDAFPIKVNGRPYITKWLYKAMQRAENDDSTN